MTGNQDSTQATGKGNFQTDEEVRLQMTTVYVGEEQQVLTETSQKRCPPEDEQMSLRR